MTQQKLWRTRGRRPPRAGRAPAEAPRPPRRDIVRPGAPGAAQFVRAQPLGATALLLICLSC